MKKIYIEVGSNQGTDSDQFIHEDSQLYCFEPCMELAFNLWNKYKDKKNVVVLPFAIDVENNFKTFNIAGTADWGCSSLNKFNKDIQSHWPGRLDFNFTHSYVVPTITLKDFIELYKIPYVDYLWIDAQGHDFNVLKSLGSKINIIKRGRCEGAYNINLYDDVNNNFNDIIKYLNHFGFETKFELDKSGIGAECDIHFEKNVLNSLLNSKIARWVSQSFVSKKIHECPLVTRTNSNC